MALWCPWPTPTRSAVSQATLDKFQKNNHYDNEKRSMHYTNELKHRRHTGTDTTTVDEQDNVHYNGNKAKPAPEVQTTAETQDAI